MAKKQTDNVISSRIFLFLYLTFLIKIENRRSLNSYGNANVYFSYFIHSICPPDILGYQWKLI